MAAAVQTEINLLAQLGLGILQAHRPAKAQMVEQEVQLKILAAAAAAAHQQREAEEVLLLVETAATAQHHPFLAAA